MSIELNLFNVRSFFDLAHFVMHFQGLPNFVTSVDVLLHHLKKDLKRLKKIPTDLHVCNRTWMKEFRRLIEMLKALRKETRVYLMNKSRDVDGMAELDERDLEDIAKYLQQGFESRIWIGKYVITLDDPQSEGEEEDEEDNEPESVDDTQVPIDDGDSTWGTSKEIPEWTEDPLVKEVEPANEDEPEEFKEDDAPFRNLVFVKGTGSMEELIKHLRVISSEDNTDNAERQSIREQIMSNMIYLT